MLRSKTRQDYAEIGTFEAIRSLSAGRGFHLAATGLGRYILHVRAAIDNVEAVRAGRPEFQTPAVIGGTPRSGLEHRSFCGRSLAQAPDHIIVSNVKVAAGPLCKLPHDGRQGCGP